MTSFKRSNVKLFQKKETYSPESHYWKKFSVYNTVTKLPVKNLNKFKETAYGGSFRQDGMLICAGSEDSVDYIRAGCVSPVNPNLILSGGYDGLIKMYDARDEAVVCTLEHGAPIESALFLPSGSVFITAGGKEIRIWDAFTRTMLARCSQYHKTVTSLSSFMNGRRLLTGSLDHRVKVIDLISYKVTHSMSYTSPILSIASSRDDGNLVTGTVSGLITIQKRGVGSTKKAAKCSVPFQYVSDTLAVGTGRINVYVTPVKTEKMSRFEKALRKYEYSRALDCVLVYEVAFKTPAVVVTLFDELISLLCGCGAGCEFFALGLFGIIDLINFLLLFIDATILSLQTERPCSCSARPKLQAAESTVEVPSAKHLCRGQYEVERNSKRRQVKPPDRKDILLHLEDLGESSDDSDFRIEDHCLDGSDSSDGSVDSNSSDVSESDESDNESVKEKKTQPLTNPITPHSDKPMIENAQVDEDIIKKILICCVCLGDRSDDTNEIIECDGCGITVHEGCYGVQDNASVSSSNSSCSTEPWFCEACRAGVDNPTCELCPNSGGIFKETDVGKWVHLVCALYIPGIAFGDPDRLSNVTLFEISSSKWGSKACQLCQDTRFVRTGMTIECDAGMCRNYFHVTCGQREGLLTEATSEEVDQADPFYAHCKLHSDKILMKKRKRNWLALQLRTQKMSANRGKKDCTVETPLWKRTQRKLSKCRTKYSQLKLTKPAPWVPMQKRPRLLTTSASACRMLWHKAELMGIDMASFEETEALITTLQDIPKKWNIPPAFSVEFIGYFLDRDARLNRLKKQLSHHAENKARLTNDQQTVQTTYDNAVLENTKAAELNESLRNTFQVYRDLILKFKPKAQLPFVDDLTNINNSHIIVPATNHHPLASAKGNVPTAAALKAGVGFPLRPSNLSIPEEKISLGLNNKCGICHKSNDQHLLAKCDTCAKFYHLGCLNPPLTRMPKKTKLMGWQCSECDRESSSSDVEYVDTEAPRKLRRSSKDRDFRPEEPLEDGKFYDESDSVELKKIKKRRREKHRTRYSPEYMPSQNVVGKHHNRKRKHKSLDTSSETEAPRQGIKLFIKSVPNSSGQANFIATQSSSSSTFVATTEEYVKTPPTDVEPVLLPPPKPKVNRGTALTDNCDTCQKVGTSANMVQCDECSKNFHFHCLDPPVKKSPKVRGYSWHCASCDPTVSGIIDDISFLA
ncbi:hypothetical protein V9T40_004102 [Parthenolecanium corni]|uniref:U3 small nucleolar RNA-associated protein 15 homolog n=1 Tax=Parthenolecanium corni TaxID=536013 RepID=A0AAN9TGF8_9HEMI